MGYYITVEPDIYVYAEDINPTGGKTIVLLHGWPGDHTLFEYQYNQLPKLGFRCVGFDMRGFGKSSKPWSGYDYDRLSDDVRAAVDALELNDFILGGHSTGGAVAVRYMARHHGHGVSKLALFAAAVPSLVQRPCFPQGLPGQAVLDIIQGTYHDRPAMLRDFGSMIFHNYTSGALSDWIFQLGLQAAGWATAAVANTWLGEEELFADLEKIQVPTLILHGYEDRVCLFPLAVAQRDAIRNSRLVALDSCGHFLFIDRMEKFNEELVRFAEE